jgi:hypothetical protein
MGRNVSLKPVSDRHTLLIGACYCAESVERFC